MVEIKLKYTEAIVDSVGEFDPKPFHGSDLAAGYDLFAVNLEIVGEKDETGLYRRVDYIQYHTGIQIQPPHEKTFSSVADLYARTYHTLIFPRSSISKYNLQLANSVGLIDTDYSGELLLRFNYLWQPEDLSWEESSIKQENGIFNQIRGIVNENRIYKQNDKIGQLIAEPTCFINFKITDNLSETDRGSGGFGSTTSKKHE